MVSISSKLEDNLIITYIKITLSVTIQIIFILLKLILTIKYKVSKYKFDLDHLFLSHDIRYKNTKTILLWYVGSIQICFCILFS